MCRCFSIGRPGIGAGVIPIYEQYRRESGQTRASYTQWEFLLAKHHGKPTYVFFTGDGFNPDNPNREAADSRACQDAYRQWIVHKGEHRDRLGTVEKLIEDVLVLPFPDLSRPKPIDLPYPPLGNLFKGRDDFLKAIAQEPHPRRRPHGDRQQCALWPRRLRQDAGRRRIRLGA